MKEIENRLRSYKDAPWPDENIVFENENIVVYKDGYPVTEGHLLFVPKRTAVSHLLDIMRCFEMAYRQGTEGVENGEWDAFNVGINNGVEAGQSVMWPHVHLIPRRKGDNPNPKGGVRNVIPCKGNYDDAIFSCDDWENEGGVILPDVDDNTPREELDAWSVKYHRKITRLKTTAKATAKGPAAKEDHWKERYEGYRERKNEMKETRVVMGVCFGESR